MLRLLCIVVVLRFVVRVCLFDVCCLCFVGVACLCVYVCLFVFVVFFLLWLLCCCVDVCVFVCSCCLFVLLMDVRVVFVVCVSFVVVGFGIVVFSVLFFWCGVACLLAVGVFTFVAWLLLVCFVNAVLRVVLCLMFVCIVCLCC